MYTGSLFGKKFTGGYIDISQAKPLSSSQEFAYKHVKQPKITAADNNASIIRDSAGKSLLSEEATNTIQHLTQDRGISTTTRKTSFMVDYSRKVLKGPSEEQAALVEKYQSLASGLQEARLKISLNGQEKEMTIGAESVKLADGQTIDLQGNAFAKALKRNQITMNGKLTVEVSVMQEFNYLDETGQSQNQKGFTIISYSYMDETGQEQTGEFAVDNTSIENSVATINGEGSVVLEERYSASNTITDTQIIDHQYQFITMVEGNNYMEIQQKYKELQRYLQAVLSVTGRNYSA